jgi:hypothetical protein
MRYQQTAPQAHCGAAGLASKMASQQEKAFCVLQFEVSRTVITVQLEFRARFKKDTPRKNNDFQYITFIGLRRWYINIAITVLEIIHRLVFYLKLKSTV